MDCSASAQELVDGWAEIVPNDFPRLPTDTASMHPGDLFKLRCRVIAEISDPEDCNLLVEILNECPYSSDRFCVLQVGCAGYIRIHSLC